MKLDIANNHKWDLFNLFNFIFSESSFIFLEFLCLVCGHLSFQRGISQVSFQGKDWQLSFQLQSGRLTDVVLLPDTGWQQSTQYQIIGMFYMEHKLFRLYVHSRHRIWHILYADKSCGKELPPTCSVIYIFLSIKYFFP